MATIKTAVSLEPSLFARVDRLAAEKGLTRSRLFAQALEEFLRREESRRLLGRLDAAHAGKPGAAEARLARRRRRGHRRLVQGEW